MENPEIPSKIQVERLIPVEIFRKKSNSFRGMTFFTCLPQRPKFSAPVVWVTSARLNAERKWKIYRCFVNGTTQFRSCFRCQKKIPVPFDGNFSPKCPYKWWALLVAFLEFLWSIKLIESTGGFRDSRARIIIICDINVVWFALLLIKLNLRLYRLESYIA